MTCYRWACTCTRACTHTHLFVLFCPSQYNTYESLTHIHSDMLHTIAPDHIHQRGPQDAHIMTLKLSVQCCALKYICDVHTKPMLRFSEHISGGTWLDLSMLVFTIFPHLTVFCIAREGHHSSTVTSLEQSTQLKNVTDVFLFVRQTHCSATSQPGENEATHTALQCCWDKGSQDYRFVSHTVARVDCDWHIYYGF